MNGLTTGEIISQALSRGLKNMVAIAVNYLLWIITIWIPYLNIGTTIGLLVGVVAKSSREEPISYTEIFNPEYRKQMGEYFLVSGFVSAGVGFGFALFFLPGVVLSIAWMLAPLFTVDGGLNAVEAIRKSNTVTYGRKAAIFWAMVVLGVIAAVGAIILSLIFNLISGALATIVVIIYIAFAASFFVAAQGYIYAKLRDAPAEAA
ncbi:hypothetical protein [Salinispira pacifica]